MVNLIPFKTPHWEKIKSAGFLRAGHINKEELCEWKKIKAQLMCWECMCHLHAGVLCGIWYVVLGIFGAANVILPYVLLYQGGKW